MAAEQINPFLTKRQLLNLIKVEMDNDFSSFQPHYKDLGDFIKPRRIRLATNENNLGKKVNQKIVNCDPTLSHRTCRAGMTAGISPSSKPWFKVTTQDPDLDEIPSVKEWCDIVAQRMRQVFLRSGVYRSLSTVYGDVAQFGTAAMYVEKDETNTIRTYVFPAGSYRISVNEKGKVDKFHREYTMTARQIVSKFGIDDKNKPEDIDWTNISEKVRNAFERGMGETLFDVAHTIYPNQEFNPKSPLSKHKRFACVYWELGSTTGAQSYSPTDRETFLEESGYDIFPVLCPRWETAGEEAYGTDCPAMTALADIKQLQTGEKRKLETVDKKVRPAMVGPTAMRNQKHSILPGDMTFVDEREGVKGFRMAHEVNLEISDLLELQQKVTERIEKAFYVDLFAIFIADDRSNITATEITETKEEKLLLLGPVLESLGGDLHDPLIGITFRHMLTDGLIPRAPDELQGRDLQVEYISVMHQAQKLIGIATDERLLAVYERLFALDPTIRHKFNAFTYLAKIGDRLSAAPGVIRTDEEANALLKSEQAIAQQQHQAEMVNQRAQAARHLGQAQIEPNNALGRVVDELDQAASA